MLKDENSRIKSSHSGLLPLKSANPLLILKLIKKSNCLKLVENKLQKIISRDRSQGKPKTRTKSAIQ